MSDSSTCVLAGDIGGIAPKILQQLQNGSFIDAFCARGRMRDLLERTPVRVILNDETALQVVDEEEADMQLGMVDLDQMDTGK